MIFSILLCVGVLGEIGSHTEEEDAPDRAKSIHVAEEGGVVEKVIDEGRKVLRSRPKTLVSRSCVGLPRRLGSQKMTDTHFEYDVSSDDEVVDPTSGVRRKGVGCLFSRAPKELMIKLLTDDDLYKLGDTKLERKVKKYLKYKSRVNDTFCYTLPSGFTCARDFFFILSFPL